MLRIMWSIVFLLIHLIICSYSIEDENCYFTVLYSNGSRSWCLDEECNEHLDIISLENHQCQTNYLSLKFSSYSKYFQVLQSNSLSSFFSYGRPNIERLLQIEFLSPLENSNPFEIDQLRYLTNSFPSNIDTYELIFNGNIKKDLTLFLNKQMFMSNEQMFIDTLRLIFNCTNSSRVEWELVKSIEKLPNSPCPEQIDFIEKTSNDLNIYILITLIVYISFVILIIICLFLWYYHNDNRLKESISQMELISIIQKF